MKKKLMVIGISVLGLFEPNALATEYLTTDERGYSPVSRQE